MWHEPRFRFVSRVRSGASLTGAALAAAIALAFAPVRARAAETDPAQRVMDRYVAAIGGRAVVDANRTVHQMARVSAFGFTGSMEFWTERPDRSATTAHIGPFTLLEGCDGATAWRTDPSGKLRVLEGHDLDRARASAWIENDRWLEPGRGGGTVTYGGVQKDSLGSYEILDVAPPVGNARRFAFDPKSGLPVRETLKEDQQTLITTMSDWRMAQGRRVAFHTHTEVVGMGANAITIDLDSIQVNVLIDPARFAPPPAPAGSVKWLKQDGVARLPFRYSGRHLWLKASINGAPPADFLYDTGASITVIDSSYAAKMGLATQGRMEASGAGSSGGASFASVRTLRVASDDGDGVEMTDQKVGVLAVNALLAPFFWRECAGVLGYGFISQFVNEIDYDRGVLVLRDPASFKYEGKGRKLAMGLAGTVPVVKMKLNGSLEGDYRLDVGSNSTVDIHGPFVKKHGLDRASGRKIKTMGAGFGGAFGSTLTRLERIDIGPFGWNDPIVSLSGATAGALASEDYAGNIGNQILERFKCTLDYDHHAVYLEPGSKYAGPELFSRAGLLFLKTGDTVTVGPVLKGSAADRAGLREGDVAVAVDGKPISSYEMDQLADLFESGEVGRGVAVEVTRGTRPMKFTFKLKDQL